MQIYYCNFSQGKTPSGQYREKSVQSPGMMFLGICGNPELQINAVRKQNPEQTVKPGDSMHVKYRY